MSDRFEEALRALREGTTGESPRARETLDRVIAAKLEARRAWRRRARLWLPIAAVLAFSTAALARWGSIEGVRARLMSIEDAPAQQPPPRVARPLATATAAAPAETPVPSDAPEAPSALALAAAPGAPAPAPEEPRPRPPRPRVRALAAPVPTTSETPPPVVGPADLQAAVSASAATAVSATSASAPESPEASAYARAHRLHFDGRDPAAALAAWDDYLVRFPDGTFAPDARYNRAIDLLKLRRYPEARAALQPFAEGAFGGYHRNDARELLHSVP